MYPKSLPIFALSILLATAIGCGTSDRDRRDYLSSIAPHLPTPTRPLVVVPGFGQTRLADPEIDRFVWGTQTSTLVRRFPDDLDLPLVSERWEHPRDRLIPLGYTQERGPLDFAWKLASPLAHHAGYTLETGEAGLYFFEYDWRLGSDHNARRLDEFLRELRESLGRPDLEIDLIGHSLGALVVTTYLSMGTASPADSPHEWKRSASRVREGLGRVVLVANPSQGVSESLRFLADGERFLLREISPSIVATFPVIYEILPERSDLFFDARSGTPIDASPDDPLFWELLGLGDATPEERRSRSILLERALAIRTAHRTNPPTDLLALQIGSDCVPTLRRVLVRADGELIFHPEELESGELRWIDELFETGDGSVTSESATRYDAPVALFCDGHHALTRDPHVHRALMRVFLEYDPSERSGSSPGAVASSPSDR